MYYVEEVTTPAQTPEADAVRTIMQLGPGTIQRVRILFPPGPCGYAHVHLLRHEHQLYPTSPGQSFAWNDYTIELADSFPLDEEPYELKILTWNDDDSYKHVIQVHVEVAEFDLTQMVVKLFRSGLGGMFGLPPR